MNRNPADLAGKEFDLLVVGAGIHGCAAAWAAARAGLRVALLDKADFGGGASANSLKIIHGGFRYLQHGNLRRMRESIRCRRRFLAWAPSIVKPRGFLVPTWGHGLRSRGVMGCALWLNDRIAWDRNAGLPAEVRLAGGRVLSRAGLQALLPFGLPAAWTGGALWRDAFAEDTERLTLSFVLDAAAHGAGVANYAEVLRVETKGGAVRGVAFRDVLTGRTHELACRALVNASGCDIDSLSGVPSARPWIKAWNVVVNRRWFGDLGVGLESPVEHVEPGALIQRGRRNFFFAPWHEGTIIGTSYRRAGEGARDPRLSEAELRETVADINAVFPDASLQRGDVTMAHVGFLPGHPDPAMRNEVDKHSEVIPAARHGGPAGLFTIKGVKYTTGLDVGMRAAAEAAAFLGRSWVTPAEEACPPPYLVPADPARAVREEGAVRLADLVFRRTAAGTSGHPGGAVLQSMAAAMGDLLGWDAARRQLEIAQVGDVYRTLGVDGPA